MFKKHPMSFRKKCKTLKALQGATAYCSELFFIYAEFHRISAIQQKHFKRPYEGKQIKYQTF